MISETAKKPAAKKPAAALDVQRVRRDFPILDTRVHGQPLVYLDTAASAQKPRQVLEAMDTCHREFYANVHRGIYHLAEKSTAAYEGVRETVRRFLGAEHREEIVFTRGTTEAVNLVAQAWGRGWGRATAHVGEGDEILVTHMEHHGNLVPWQMLAEQTGARLRVAPIDDRGELILEEMEALLSPRTRMVAVSHVSNVLGTVNPVRHIAERAHAHGARVLVDGAQAVQHLPVDVGELGCDFYAFSGHKLYGPTGIGVLWGRRELLEAMPPWQGGGDMIRSVTLEKTEFAPPPHRFEAGTPHIVGAVGLGAAIDYVSAIGLEAIEAHERALLAYATERLTGLPWVRVVGTAPGKAGVLSLDVAGVHPHDVATVLDRRGIAIRAGHHCAQPLMDRFGVAATARASLGMYNTREEVDALMAGLRQVHEIFGL
jgi:cysteine desulfurase/selenocysteine lyase